MVKEPPSSRESTQEEESETLPGVIDRKARRKARARKRGDRSVWFGIGMFGMVGWTIALTTILGLVLGRAMDQAWPGSVSWTLTMFFAGLILGCMNAWYWVSRESRLDDDTSPEDPEE